MKRAVLVNGVPASGKSTVAHAIAGNTGWPVLALDTIKEALFVHLGSGDRAYNRRLGMASYEAIFALIAGFPAGTSVIIDAWFGFQPVEVLTGHLARAGLTAIVEIWCHAAPETIGERYTARVPVRPSGHPGTEYVAELMALARTAKPFGLFPVIDVDTTAAISAADIVARVDAALSASGN